MHFAIGFSEADLLVTGCPSRFEIIEQFVLLGNLGLKIMLNLIQYG